MLESEMTGELKSIKRLSIYYVIPVGGQGRIGKDDQI